MGTVAVLATPGGGAGPLDVERALRGEATLVGSDADVFMVLLCLMDGRRSRVGALEEILLDDEWPRRGSCSLPASSRSRRELGLGGGVG